MALTTLPVITNEAGQKVPAQPVILVDPSGDYAGGGGGGGGGDASAANQDEQTALLEAQKADLDVLASAAQSTAPVNTYPMPVTPVSGLTAAMTGTASTLVTGMSAPGSGKNNYITQITVSNSHATQGTDVEIQDGNGGATIYVIPAAAVYGGGSISFPTPLKQPTVNTALYAKNTTTGASTRVSASGFQA